MAQKKVDRRVQRTRELLTKSLISLIAEKGYDALTVQDIIDHANIGRSTFYAHYRDKEDLLLRGFEGMMDILVCKVEHVPSENAISKRQRIVTALPLFQHTQENHRLYKAMVGGRGMEVVMKFIQANLCKRIQAEVQQLLSDERTPTVPPTIIANHLAGTLLTLLAWWHDNDMPYPPEQMDEMFQTLTMPGVWAALDIKSKTA